MMGKSILILDEDERLWKLVSPLLQSRGHQTASANSGKDGLEIVKEQGLSLDLAVVGENLSDIDGIGWIVKLRQITRDVKIVYISNSWKDPELYQQLTKEFGVGLVVHRPLKPSLFGVQVESLFATNEVSLPETTAVAPTSLEVTLQGLRDKYTKVLPQRLEALSQAVAKAKSDASGIPEARRLAHNLKGTASSSGFEPIGQAAGRIERAFDAITKGVTENVNKEWSEIESSLSLAVAQALLVSKQQKDTPEDQRRPAMQVPDLAKARVLIVSDDPLPALDGANGILPVELIRAASPSDAIDRACVFLLDAALIDVTTQTEAASFNLARSLRGMKGYENLPLGFIVNSGQKSDRIEGTHAGASIYLQKPLESHELQKAMQYLIGVREGGRSRVLIVDDDEDFAGIIAVTLANEGMLVRSIQDPARTQAMMEEFSPDLLLLDVNMPGVSGFDVCRMLRSTPRWQDVPILFLTAETGLDARITAFDAGGDDYLPKPVANVELLTRVKVRLERSRMLKERTDKDVLTGLLLRRPFMEQMEALLAEAQRHSFKFCMCLLDVDHFKKVNDTYGHLAGDRVLTYFGGLLKMRFRVEDLRGRWGGEEFIMAFRHETKDTMRGALTRVLDELSVTPFQGDHGETFHVTFSSGMASFPEDGDNLHDLVQRADRRLYIAKETGRKRVVTDDEI
jgi:diguanylate cyclase (GGDEF)-like protein